MIDAPAGYKAPECLMVRTGQVGDSFLMVAVNDIPSGAKRTKSDVRKEKYFDLDAQVKQWATYNIDLKDLQKETPDAGSLMGGRRRPRLPRQRSSGWRAIKIQMKIAIRKRIKSQIKSRSRTTAVPQRARRALGVKSRCAHALMEGQGE
jgi:hypothetical protein